MRNHDQMFNVSEMQLNSTSKSRSHVRVVQITIALNIQLLSVACN